jgi:hypothetical protein
MFQISTKEGPRVPFKLNTFQLWLDEMIHDPDYHSFILAKPRQKGGSSYIEAILSTRCLGKIGTRAVVMSHEGEATQRLLDKVHFYLKYTTPLPAYDRNSRNELAFGKTDSTFYIGTAGARAFGRGDTITDLHACFFPDTVVMNSQREPSYIENAGSPTLINYSGPIISVKGYTVNFPIKVTPDHKILTRRGLVPAGEVTTRDWLVFPKQKVSETILDIPLYHHLREGNTWRWIEKRRIPLDFSFGEVVGLYYAEGSLTHARMSFAFHQKEKNLHELVKAYFEASATSISMQEQKNGLGVEVYIFGNDWVKTFEEHFYKDGNKHLPNWFFDTPEEFRKGFIRGFFLGDGYPRPDGPGVCLKQHRPQPVLQMRELLCAMGYGWSNFKSVEDDFELILFAPGAIKIRELVLGHSLNYRYRNHTRKWEEDSENVYVKIMSIEVEEVENVTLYDLLNQPDGLVHCIGGTAKNSEYAYWIDAVKHSVGLFQAVPASGFKILESTGNGRNNDFHYIWQHAERMGYKRLFAPWLIDLEYSRRLPYADWSLRDADTQHLTYLINMQKKFNLSLEQMFWYVCKLAELRDDLHLMQQEYPSEPEECFQATSGSVFPDVELTPSKAWQDISRFNTRMFGLPDHPKPDLHYTFGGDPSGGTGHDDAALVAFCVETFEQVLRFSSNTTDPVIFAKLLMDLGRHYNHAYLVTESNNHGAAVIPILKRDYDRSLLYYYKRATTKSPAKYGWLNSQQHKQELVGGMQEMLDQYTFYDKKTVEEFQKFEEDVEGKMGAKSDNLVIAGGLGMLGCMKQIRFRTDYLTPPPPLKEKPSSYMYYTLDEALKSIEVLQRGSGYFKPQVRIGEIWPSA